MLHMLDVNNEIHDRFLQKFIQGLHLIARFRQTPELYEPEDELIVWKALNNEGFLERGFLEIDFLPREFAEGFPEEGFYERIVQNMVHIHNHSESDIYIDRDYWLNNNDLMGKSLNEVIKIFS